MTRRGDDTLYSTLSPGFRVLIWCTSLVAIGLEAALVSQAVRIARSGDEPWTTVLLIAATVLLWSGTAWALFRHHHR